MSAVRTSETHPIYVDWIETPEAEGRLGVTIAPGKHASSAFGTRWERNLERDLEQLEVLGANVLVTLLEDDEMDRLNIRDLPGQAADRFTEVLRLPIPDGHVSAEPERAATVVARITEHLAEGRNVVVHCRGGLGRAGTISACTLVRLGIRPDDAIQTVRTARPGAIENTLQEDFVRSF